MRIRRPDELPAPVAPGNVWLFYDGVVLILKECGPEI
jgi:hypothetical protein